MTATDTTVRREQIEVNGTSLSYLTSGDAGDNTLLLLHGTFWSRVWQPLLAKLGESVHCIALDLPGFGRSDGELDVDEASVPALAGTVLDAADALGLDTFAVAAHDIGGGIAQHLAVHSRRVSHMVLMNAVMFDSWPVPAVARFRDPAVRESVTAEQLQEGRREATRRAVSRELTEEELADYLSPWQDSARSRSWMAMAAAADNTYTLELVTALKEAAVPTRLVWGRDDEFQKIEFARRYVREIPASDLIEVTGKHIPTEDSPEDVAAAILEHLQA
ncbi:alpha/beta fold hydrolase [Nesterenkonia sp. Act20]|uniref:alpha/beta fold hydrolase n=1 Tax=Nesterenkonia sp. Act20 TaxID=1483432 RepID=UPI001C45CD78|nr:alpha/beta hydrolase [Nesterenkonia sp. Act20]